MYCHLSSGMRQMLANASCTLLLVLVLLRVLLTEMSYRNSVV